MNMKPYCAQLGESHVTDRIQCTDGMLLKRLIYIFVIPVLCTLSNDLLSGKQAAML